MAAAVGLSLCSTLRRRSLSFGGKSSGMRQQATDGFVTQRSPRFASAAAARRVKSAERNRFQPHLAAQLHRRHALPRCSDANTFKDKVGTTITVAGCHACRQQTRSSHVQRRKAAVQVLSLVFDGETRYTQAGAIPHRRVVDVCARSKLLSIR